MSKTRELIETLSEFDVNFFAVVEDTDGDGYHFTLNETETGKLRNMMVDAMLHDEGIFNLLYVSVSKVKDMRREATVAAKKLIKSIK